MPLLHPKRNPAVMAIKEYPAPELFREMFPYTKVSRVAFDGIYVEPRPASPMFITDTTFRDGQQARPPYTVEQIVHLYDLLHELGGRSGLIRATEFFMYSEKDRKAIEACRTMDYAFPKVTGWIRAVTGDLRLARDMEFNEVGMLTSVSDYHIFLKLGWDRRRAFDHYIAMATQALEWGIAPRCHFEDITRADVPGFCLPLAARLMELGKDSGIPVKIRLCDTMGYGVPYPGAALPRSVPRLVRAFTDEAGVPGECLEWHGHNDLHKVLINGTTAWLYGCGGVNCTLMGFGERTGNSPLEAMVIEYISLSGDDNAANPKVISTIARYFETELDYRIPDNYPLAGRDFNATSAGVHVDGLAKNEEIYNIFDTSAILGRDVPIIITDKSGRAGVAYWLNQHLNLDPEQKVSKTHPAVGMIYYRIMTSYDHGRNTSYSNKEMLALAKRYMPDLFPSELRRLHDVAGKLAKSLMLRLAGRCEVKGEGTEHYPWMPGFLAENPFIQYVYVTNTKARLLGMAISNEAYRENYNRLPLGFDFSSREWFINPMRDGGLHISNIYQSQMTGKLVLTVSTAITDKNDKITGVLGADIELEELLRRADGLETEENGEKSDD
ncbi:MAG: histone-lysine N-methyltransferase [Deltaproteobacteria bacterium]|jgi:isopropylmalate/homocitrate/citramalate synthase|nr:histone-lysine N-methyltransferase [Deltaproteobacteria bacterium]